MLMTVAAVMAVLWPLSRHRDQLSSADPDTQFYQDQIAEIDRDCDRGLLSVQEAEAAKIEAARRLLRSSKLAPVSEAVGEPALRRRRAVSALALSVVPLLALAIYGAYGSPQLPGQPLQARLQVDPQQLDVATALARIEAHLAQRPDDGRGWEVVAPVYVRSGRLADAVRAYQAAIRLLGESAGRLADYGEALILLNEGIVSAEARAVLERSLALDASVQKSRFYLARAAEQDGEVDRARGHYAEILSSSPPDAPWLPAVRARLASLAGAGEAGQPAADMQDAIKGMVAGLAARLDGQGGSPEEWIRLVRSYKVLGEHEKAQAALDKARQTFAADQVALRNIDAIARELNLAAVDR